MREYGCQINGPAVAPLPRTTAQQERTLMDTRSIAEREIAAYVRGFEEETREIRGYGLSEAERAEVELEAHAIYGAPPLETEVAPLAA